tara:strand:- start:2117 stop:2341 length:225 start_codon:yes stop_codon:yes gene_type:complete
MNDLKLNLLLENFLEVIDYYQFEMESNYHENSMLTDLFLENKFLGWLGLFIVFFAIFAVLVFQFLDWESKDNNK